MRSRWYFTALVAAAFALRAATPAGYMPGSLADGFVFVLCPGGSPALAQFLDSRTAAAHHAHGAEGGDAAAPWAQCVFAAAALAAISPDPAGQMPTGILSRTVQTPAAERHRPAPFLAKQARGPPPVAT